MPKIRIVPRGLFSSESELCEHFSRLAAAKGYTVHREVGTWDLLLVEPETDLQIGVQAKLRASVEVLAQALTSERRAGPDVHAVLVPMGTYAFLQIASELRIKVFEAGLMTTGARDYVFSSHIKRWNHPKREWVPDCVVDVPAGVPAPRRITRWKLGAVKLCLRLRERGYVTPDDLKEFKLDRNWWFSPTSGPVLCQRVERVDGILRTKRGQYVFVDPASLNNPDLRWPEIARALTTGGAPRVRRKRSDR